MKKMLSIFSVLLVSATPAYGVISCGTAAEHKNQIGYNFKDELSNLAIAYLKTNSKDKTFDKQNATINNVWINQGNWNFLKNSSKVLDATLNVKDIGTAHQGESFNKKYQIYNGSETAQTFTIGSGDTHQVYDTITLEKNYKITQDLNIKWFNESDKIGLHADFKNVKLGNWDIIRGDLQNRQESTVTGLVNAKTTETYVCYENYDYYKFAGFISVDLSTDNYVNFAYQVKGDSKTHYDQLYLKDVIQQEANNPDYKAFFENQNSLLQYQDKKLTLNIAAGFSLIDNYSFKGYGKIDTN